MNFQKTIIAGRVVRTPQLKDLPNGSKVVNFTIVTNRVWKNANGEKQESAEFHNCIAFGKTADTIGQYVQSGQVLLVEGRNQTSSWEDKDGGAKRYKTEVIVETFQFGEKSKNKDENTDEDDGMRYGMTKEEQEAAKIGHKIPKDEAFDHPGDDDLDINPDDIPF